MLSHPHRERLRLAIGARMIPDERKAATRFPRGEDAFFVSRDLFSFGVADGVGGWSLRGIDSGEFSRELMQRAKHYFDANPNCDVREAMIFAERETVQQDILGTCTMCALSLRDNQLQSALVGDSGFVLLRRQRNWWSVVYKSQEQQHQFNAPYQIGLNSRTTVKRSAVRASLPVRAQDIVLCGTDGLFDNLWLREICAMLDESGATSDASALANLFAERAVFQSKLPNKRSPFSTQCAAAGYGNQEEESNGNGEQGGDGRNRGKRDDVTAIVAIVT